MQISCRDLLRPPRPKRRKISRGGRSAQGLDGSKRLLCGGLGAPRAQPASRRGTLADAQAAHRAARLRRYGKQCALRHGADRRRQPPAASFATGNRRVQETSPAAERHAYSGMVEAASAASRTRRRRAAGSPLGWGGESAGLHLNEFWRTEACHRAATHQVVLSDGNCDLGGMPSHITTCKSAAGPC